MTQTNTTPAAPATLTEQIDYAIQSCADEGIGLTANNAAELLANIDDPEITAQHLEEIARLIRATSQSPGATSGPKDNLSPREHVLEHIFEVIRDTDHGDDYQAAIELLNWMEVRTWTVADNRLVFFNPDHPVTVDDLNNADCAHVMGLKLPTA